MIFANPELLFLLIIIPLLIIWYIFKYRKGKADLQLSTTEGLENAPITLKQRLIHSLFVFRIIAITLLIIAIARPQSTSKHKTIEIQGIDIIVDLDISSSMLAQDLKPNRLEAAKRIAQTFLDGRTNDRVGLVIFAGEAYTQVPLTTDHTIISNLFKDVRVGSIEDGTAIGDAIATGVSRLENSEAVSKVLILITDGVNNSGNIDPKTAAEIAKTYNVRIYAIGVGKEGFANTPYQTPFGTRYANVKVEIDEALLKDIAKTTGGQYFRATSNSSLQQIYQEIDKLEKSKIDVNQFSKKYEEFFPLALIALLLFILEIILRKTIFRTIP
ncbi:MAG: VWA domain-containing protein [Bacteroidales bacterium]